MLAYNPDFITQLPSLPETVKLFGLQPNKKLGQNFLYDQDVTDRIVAAAGSLQDKIVVEIGPGPGGLTRSILRAGVKKLYCLEKDERCMAALKPLEEYSNGVCTILNEDALRFDYASLAEVPLVVIANLPYNVSTSLLMNWLEQIELFDHFTLMFQKEVAERIVAKPRTKDYGRLSVLSQYICQSEMLYDIPPELFVPPPKVTSTVIHMVPKQRDGGVKEYQQLQHITSIAFAMRRKTLRNNLKAYFSSEEADRILKEASLIPTQRPEELSVSDFVRLASLSV